MIRMISSWFLADAGTSVALSLCVGRWLSSIVIGDYRIILQVRDRALVVLLVKIGHRREIYR